MSTIVRKTPDALVFASVFANNKRQIDGVGSNFHYDITSVTTGDYMLPTIASDTVATANATDLTTSIALVNSEKRVINRHYADFYVLPLQGGAHKVANMAISTADATDLTTGVTLGNAIKSSYETHRASTTFHANADGTNTISSANATDQATLNTLLNEIKTDFNAHVISAPAGTMLKVVDA